jgi:hypothetical protein
MGGSAERRRAAFEQQLRWIADARDPASHAQRLGVRVFFGAISGVGTTREALAAPVAAGLGIEIDDVLTSPFGMIGDAAAIRDHFVEVHERYGISYFTLNEDLALQVGPVIDELSR